jgi:hypothetical protein
LIFLMLFVILFHILVLHTVFLFILIFVYNLLFFFVHFLNMIILLVIILLWIFFLFSFLLRFALDFVSFFLLIRNVKLKLQRKLVFWIKTIAEINSSDSAIRVQTYPERFDVIGPISSSSEVSQVKLDLVPSVVQFHRHCADERLYFGLRRVIGGPESPLNVFVVENLNLKAELLLHVFDHHDQKR